MLKVGQEQGGLFSLPPALTEPLSHSLVLREYVTNALLSSKFHSPTDTGQQERSSWSALLLRWFHAIQRKSRVFGPGKENRSKYNKYS